MNVESFDPTSQVVSVTPVALEHFRRQLANQPGKAVRISLKKSGCTGFRYVVDLVEEGAETDMRYQLDDQVELLVDRSCLEVISGSEIDLVKEGINQQIRFTNPNVKDQCGCGESFSVS